MSQLSLSEVATVLGKSERQVRYMIKTERLKAKKVGGRWMVESSDLPLSKAQREALDRRVETARAAFEKGIAPSRRAAEQGKKRYYSVKDLDAFTIGLELYRETCKALGAEGSATSHLLLCLQELTIGCHVFHPADKAAHFASSRKEATTALVHLLIADGEGEPPSKLADRLEQELIPKVSSLIAGQERRRRRR